MSAGNGCASQDSPQEVDVQQPLLSVTAERVVAELISLGRIEILETIHPVDPPYELTPTETSERLREMAFKAQSLEANDPERFYTIRIDMVTGEVFAVARSKSAARAYAERLAPHGIAPSSPTEEDMFVEKWLSDGIENRINVATTTYDPWNFIRNAGYFSMGGSCTGTLFADHAVVTAAHCAISNSGPGWSNLTFAPRQRSFTSQPYGVGTTTYIEYETAYIAHNCHVSSSDNACFYHDFVIVAYPSNSFSMPGYLGFSWLSDTDLQKTYNQNVGYPSCMGSGCLYGVPFSDWYCANRHPFVTGGSTSNSWPYSDGTNPLMWAACDITGGHSGGSFIDRSNQNILAVVSAHACYGSNCAYSGIGPRINGPMFDWMMSFR